MHQLVRTRDIRDITYGKAYGNEEALATDELQNSFWAILHHLLDRRDAMSLDANAGHCSPYAGAGSLPNPSIKPASYGGIASSRSSLRVTSLQTCPVLSVRSLAFQKQAKRPNISV